MDERINLVQISNRQVIPEAAATLEEIFPSDRPCVKISHEQTATGRLALEERELMNQLLALIKRGYFL